MNVNRSILLLMTAFAVGSLGAAASANHKEGHHNPPGFERNMIRDHANTVNSNAGIGNGGEPCCNLPDTDSELHEIGGDTDPGNSETVNQAGVNQAEE